MALAFEPGIISYDSMKGKDGEMKKDRVKKRKRLRLAAVTLTLALALTGCGGSTTETGSTGQTVTPDQPAPASAAVNLSANISKVDIPETQMPDNHRSALAKGGIALLKKTVEIMADGTENVLISPISLQMALGMTAAGSDEGSKTRSELMAVLMPGPEGDPAALNAEMASFAERMKNSKDVEWNVANSVWVNQDGNVKLKDSFLSTAANYYKAELFSAPFNEATVKAINEWVSGNTKQRIPTILDQLDPDARIALVNAVCFDAEWAEPYENEQILEDQTFTNSDGSKAKVTMLTSNESRVIQLAGGLGFVRPYKGGRYSFAGILPPEGMSTEDYLQKILDGGEDFTDAYLNSHTTRDVYVKIPEFKTEFGSNMDKVLKGLGLNEAYSNGAAFHEMVTEDSEAVKIGTVEHKAMIEVDRNGTKAAAATMVEMDKVTAVEITEEPYVVYLDRPFIYAIVDDTTGVPVFLGSQNTM